MRREIPIVRLVQLQAQTNDQLMQGCKQGPFCGPKLQDGVVVVVVVVVVVDDDIDFEDSDDGGGQGQDRLELQYQADLFF